MSLESAGALLIIALAFGCAALEHSLTLLSDLGMHMNELILMFLTSGTNVVMICDHCGRPFKSIYYEGQEHSSP